MTRKPKILIADDNLSSLRILTTFLKDHDFDLRVARSGEEALRRVSQSAPDIILLDIRMPGRDGLGICRELKADPASREIPVIFMTALTDSENKLKGFEAGAADYITKPFDPEEVMARLRAHLTIRKLRIAVAEERDRFRALSEATDEGICIHDGGRVLEVNGAMERLTGYGRSELLGRQLSEFLEPDFQSELDENCHLEARMPWEIRSRTKEGERALFEVREKPIRWEGKERGMLAIRDITLRRRLENENITLRASLSRSDHFGEMAGRSPVMKKLYEYLSKASATDETVILYGETGTGKELAARTLFQLSASHGKSFVAVNCAAILEHLFESLFFGYRKGAFTGARADTHGFFDQARGGTLFLDEVGELTLPMQAKLLRVLQDGEYTPIGATQSCRADVRIIAATNRELRKMMKSGLIREDFFHRIHVIALELPPLRWHKEDIPLLVSHFLSSRPDNPRALPRKIMETFMAHDWPGNVRELFNEIRRYLAMGEIQICPDAGRAGENVAAGSSPHQDDLSLKEAVRDFERDYITRILNRCDGSRKEAAEVLGVDRKTLYNKMNKESN